jgi:hypothetical protein
MAIELKLDPKDVCRIIDSHVRKAIMEALGKDPESLIKAVVDSAMSAKSSSFSNKTLFIEASEQMIRDAAREVFKEWLSDKKVLIQNAISKRLKEENSAFIETIADKMVAGLASSFYVSCTLKCEQ